LRQHAQYAEDLDAKDCVLRWAERGELPLSRPLIEQMRVALERLDFKNVGIEHEERRNIWMIRADVGTNSNCTSPRMARSYLHRMARLIGKRLNRAVDYLVVKDGTVRTGITFKDP
jgi:hypothetical protein